MRWAQDAPKVEGALEESVALDRAVILADGLVVLHAHPVARHELADLADVHDLRATLARLDEHAVADVDLGGHLGDTWEMHGGVGCMHLGGARSPTWILAASTSDMYSSLMTALLPSSLTIHTAGLDASSALYLARRGEVAPPSLAAVGSG